ncbi:hypothetical protein D9V74_01555 [Buchnera aphidicola (Macrosiphoniella sanborni)]|uniref:Methyltransferase small N-terminal domain-containing protein n=1 Tax=Buchnera aphidicola (Macrosiphoniella sanborni) TaxID=1241865 RepID=A0A4D6Y2X2_9GAMM|nr:hypothetical protein [Buchnera aphidicola]QCI23866.1 hypothetical protein D9V74_01555 [Buchnera aphidicola (Macrosiphoniella sanborni)]
MLISQNSQLILRNKKIFEKKKVLFFGNIKDDYPLYLQTINTKIHVKKYDFYIFLKKKILKKLVFIIIYYYRKK